MEFSKFCPMDTQSKVYFLIKTTSVKKNERELSQKLY